MSQYFDTIELQTERQWIDIVLDKLFDAVQLSINNNNVFNIAVSGGSTPGVIFRNWVKDERMSSLWNRVVFYWVDERLVPASSPDSNYGNAMMLLGELPAAFRPMYNGTDDMHIAVDKYKEVLSAIPQRNDVPVFDMILLGMGEDGHTASLFPDTSALRENHEWVVANNAAQLKTDRITLTYPVLMTADKVIVLFNGSSKKQLLHNMKNGVSEYPVYKLIERKSSLQWIYY